MTELRVGSLFSGVGGFDLGFEQAGFRIAWQCEIEPWACAVLRRHWPDVPLHGDIRTLHASDLSPVDVVVLGSPCQDLSIAGKRVGLVGERSGLFFEATRILRELRPAWVVWENVPDALNSNSGHDFAAVLDTLGDCGFVELGWRILDAQWWGVAQRRRRLFVVGSPRIGGAQAVLFDGEGGAGNPASLRSTLDKVADLAAQSTGGDCSLSAQRVANTLGTRRRYGKGTDSDATDTLVLSQAENQRHELRLSDQVSALSTGGGKPGRGYPAVAFHARQDPIHGAVSPALDSNGSGSVAVAAGWGVRRLTPRECNRLQGFPDDWDRWTDGGREIADSHRYRLMGNAVCVNVAAWIAKRLLAVMEAND